MKHLLQILLGINDFVIGVKYFLRIIKIFLRKNNLRKNYY
jgi:hypothetical protein